MIFPCLCLIASLLFSAATGYGFEPSLSLAETQEEMPVVQQTRGQAVTCRFIPVAGAPQHQSTCIAEHLTTTFYRRVASCRGYRSCVLNVPPLTSKSPVRLWSPDSQNQTFFYVLPPTYTFQVFPRAAQATKGPWISRATPTSMVVRWETDIRASSWLRVVNKQFPSPNMSRWVQGSSSCSAGAAPPCIHTATVTGLAQGRSYDVVLGDVRPDAATGNHPVGSFSTVPAAGIEYSFAVLGDVQGQGGAAWKEVGELTGDLQGTTGRSGGPILHTGDMTGSVSHWNGFFSDGASTLSRHPFYPALGNNDDPGSFKKYFSFTGTANPTTYYSVGYGKTHFIVLDSNSLSSCDTTNAQANWLRQDLVGTSATAAENIVIVAHWGPHGYGVYGDNPTLKPCIESLFRDSSGQPTNLFRKLRVVFSGHQHYYERIVQTHTVGTLTRKVHYVTVGTAGAEPRCPGSGAGLVASSASVWSPDDGTFDYQGVVVDVRGQVFELRAYNFAYDSMGQRVPRGSSGQWYSLLDCFAMNAAGDSVTPDNSCAQ